MNPELNNQSQLALKVLKDFFGYSSYRPGQEEIIQCILRNENILAVMPTGAGKSLCYQIPAIVSQKKTVIISPLIALINDQVDSLKQNGISVEKIHSNQSDNESRNSWIRFRDGQSKIIYMSPERLMMPKMIEHLSRMEMGMFVIDEAHCISKWGQSFRPDYEELSKLKNLFPNTTLASFTATADSSTRNDIVQKIANGKAKIILKGFDRPNLSLSVSLKSKWADQLLEFLSKRKGLSGIVYCLSRKKTEEVANLLNENGYNAGYYHAGLDSSLRKNVQDKFMTEEGYIVVATIAFGMGIDKPDIRFVAHVNLPSSMESYYQEIGRAGRDGAPSDTLLIYGLEDLVLRRRMIDGSEYDPSVKLRENKRLDALLSYCETPYCRRKYLLSYFENECSSCQNCDNCLNPPNLKDGTDLAQKLLSVILQTGQKFGQNHIINVLRGSEDSKIFDKRHDKLPTYGLGKEQTKDFWRSFLRQMLAFGHLQINFQEFGAIQLTESGMNVLENEEIFEYKDIIKKANFSVRKRKNVYSSEISSSDQIYLNSLKSLRLVLARDKSIPAYAVFNDETLKQLVINKPKTNEEFLKINGVGPSKLKRYGKIFLEAISNF